MFFKKDKEIEKLKKEINFLKEAQEKWDILLYITNVSYGVWILLDMGVLSEIDLLKYIGKHLTNCIKITARNKFNLKGFEINPEKKEEYVSNFTDMCLLILDLSKNNKIQFENDESLEKEKQKIKDLFFALVLQIEIFASPNPEYNYNISEFN